MVNTAKYVALISSSESTRMMCWDYGNARNYYTEPTFRNAMVKVLCSGFPVELPCLVIAWHLIMQGVAGRAITNSPAILNFYLTTKFSSNKVSSDHDTTSANRDARLRCKASVQKLIKT